MQKKTVSVLLLTLLLLSMLTLAFGIQPVTASGTIYIRPDGTVEGTDKIQRDGDVYTFTANIYDEIVVERDNVVVDGAGYNLQGTGVYPSKGILSARSNVTFKNMEIKYFCYGIYLFGSANNNVISGNHITNNYEGIHLFNSTNNDISGNTITNNDVGIWLAFSSSNVISGNTITSNNFLGILLPSTSNNNVISGNTIANSDAGIVLASSANNVISGNHITNNYEGIVLASSANNNVISGNTIANSDVGIVLASSANNDISGNTITDNTYGVWPDQSSNNTISGNTIANSDAGIVLSSSANNTISGNTIANNYAGVYPYSSSDNTIYHNNFADNTEQVYLRYSFDDFWDDGYPSGGNHWSDHVTVDSYSGVNQDESGSDGIVDEPYIIDADNRDNYPLVEPWTPVIPATVDIAPDSLHLMSQGQWITCYIELPEGYNVSDIDVSTIMLNDTIPVSLLDVPAPDPVPTEVGDYDEDGIPDLMVKFNRTMVSAFILSERITNGVVTLTITGNVNGAPFEGADTIRVLMGGGGRRGHK